MEVELCEGSLDSTAQSSHSPFEHNKLLNLSILNPDRVTGKQSRNDLHFSSNIQA